MPSMDAFEFVVPLLVTLFLVCAAAAHPAAADVVATPVLAPMDYWQAVLPETPMPRAIQDLLTQSTGSQGEDDSRKLTTSYGYLGEDSRKATTSYGSQGEDDPCKVTKPYGSQGEVDSRKVTTSYGFQGDKDPKKVTMSYGFHGENSRKVIDKDPKKATMSYGFHGENSRKVTDKKDPQKATMSYGFHGENSRKVTNQDPKKATMSYGFHDENSRKVTNEDPKKATMSYGFHGENSREVTDKDPKKATMSYGFHGENSKEVTDKDSKKATISYGFHGENSRKVTDKDPKKATISYGFHGDINDHDVHSHNHNHNNGNKLADVFFFQGVLRPGSVITPTIPPTTSLPSLLPRREADLLPFSTERFADILDMLAPTSDAMGKEIWWTLNTCENPPSLAGEKAACATSLESLAKLPAALLGTRSVRAFSGNMPTDPADTSAQRGRYNVTAVRMLSESLTVATCHDLTYPYAVFYCHTTNPATTYLVKLAAQDGRTPTMEALVVCHLDTSLWSPRHPFLVAHNLKPGDTAVCHFLSKLSIVWVPVVGEQEGMHEAQ